MRTEYAFFDRCMFGTCRAARTVAKLTMRATSLCSWRAARRLPDDHAHLTALHGDPVFDHRFVAKILDEFLCRTPHSDIQPLRTPVSIRSHIMQHNGWHVHVTHLEQLPPDILKLDLASLELACQLHLVALQRRPSGSTRLGISPRHSMNFKHAFLPMHCWMNTWFPDHRPHLGDELRCRPQADLIVMHVGVGPDLELFELHPADGAF